MADGPLSGLRVIELTDDTGRFAGKLLRDCGASVVRLTDGFPGPAMVHAAAAARGGLLDWWYDGGKQRHPVDLTTAAGRDDYRRLAEHADLVIDTMRPGLLGALEIDHPQLVEANPALVQVSLTPFGRTGPRADWQTSDLVTGALSGVLSISGTPDQAVGAWGRQNLNLASSMACICGLAGLYSARETGRGQHVDLSLHEFVTTTIENLFFQWWFPDCLPMAQRALRQGSLHWIGAYVVANARTGACNIAPVPDPRPLFEWMAEEGDAEGVELSKLTLIDAIAQMPRVMNAIKRFALTKDSGELFHEAQRRHIAFGEVQTIAQVATNPQYEFRGTFRAVEGFPGVRLPGPFADFRGTPPSAAQPPMTETTPLEELLADWSQPRLRPATPEEHHHRGPTSAGKPLEGVRIADFTWVLAGPYANRILGDLGADVLKFQTAERATLVNSPDFPYFYVWNRSKRLVSLNMKREEAIPVIRSIIEQSDVLMENFSAGVLARWGLDYESVRAWNPNIVYVSMSGPGHEGPWSNMITYAPTIHGLCGLTYLSNPPDRRDVGPGFSINDHAAGLLSVVAVLSALEARRRTGEGQHVDIAQMETGTYLIGPALVDYLSNGREAHPIGNVDPFGQWCPNEVYRCGDQEEVAITCRTDDEWAKLCETVSWDIADLARDPELATAAGRFARRKEIDEHLRVWCSTRLADDAAEALQANGVPAGKVQDAPDLTVDPQHVYRELFRPTDHAVFGERTYDRFPAIWSGTDLEPYVLSGAYIGEANFDVYTELAGISEEDIALGIGDGLYG
jgi:crotonobetainyl-CoA:carnitine CoA-transferase CaiB-like acyl-CoA transferase